MPTLLYFRNEGIDLGRQGTQLAPLTVNMARFTLHAKLALRLPEWVRGSRDRQVDGTAGLPPFTTQSDRPVMSGIRPNPTVWQG